MAIIKKKMKYDMEVVHKGKRKSSTITVMDSCDMEIPEYDSWNIEDCHVMDVKNPNGNNVSVYKIDGRFYTPIMLSKTMVEHFYMDRNMDIPEDTHPQPVTKDLNGQCYEHMDVFHKVPCDVRLATLETYEMSDEWKTQNKYNPETYKGDMEFRHIVSSERDAKIDEMTKDREIIIDGILYKPIDLPCINISLNVTTPAMAQRNKPLEPTTSLSISNEPDGDFTFPLNKLHAAIEFCHMIYDEIRRMCPEYQGKKDPKIISLYDGILPYYMDDRSKIDIIHPELIDDVNSIHEYLEKCIESLMVADYMRLMNSEQMMNMVNYKKVKETYHGDDIVDGLRLIVQQMSESLHNPNSEMVKNDKFPRRWGQLIKPETMADFYMTAQNMDCDMTPVKITPDKIKFTKPAAPRLSIG